MFINDQLLRYRSSAWRLSGTTVVKYVDHSTYILGTSVIKSICVYNSNTSPSVINSINSTYTSS